GLEFRRELFRSAARRQDDPPGLLAHHQALCEEGGHSQEAVAAYRAACVRDPFAEQRRGFAGRSAPARAQRRLDDADLYARGPRAHEGAPQPAPSARLRPVSAVDPGASLLESTGSAHRATGSGEAVRITWIVLPLALTAAVA